jgi:hypothetical protein
MVTVKARALLLELHCGLWLCIAANLPVKRFASFVREGQEQNGFAPNLKNQVIIEPSYAFATHVRKTDQW